MARGLAQAGFEVYNPGGPSPRLPLEEQVTQLRSTLEGLAREIGGAHAGEPPLLHGVGHSLGGVILRVALAQADGIVPGRLVAAATPFLGTRIADFVSQHRIARMVLGPAIEDLSWYSPTLRRFAASVGDRPEIGVIFGRCGFQPFLPAAWINAYLGLRDTDGTIQPSSARGDDLWPAPADVLELRTGHTFIAEKTEVIRCAARFLANGRFGASAEPQWAGPAEA